jgi:putative ABC transport system permease protein
MKDIRVGDQPGLSLGRTLRITIDGIRYRLFRSLVTVCVIAVAVAFLLNILSESLIKRAVARDTRDRIAQSRMVHVWTSRLGGAGTAEAILRELASAEPGDARMQEIMSMGKLSEGEMESFHLGARDAVACLDFFADLDYARRRRLVHQAEGIGILDRLAGEGAFEAFLEILKATPSVRLPDSQGDLQAFLATWPRISDFTIRVQEGQKAAVDRLTQSLGQKGLTAALAEEDFGRTVREAGFFMDEETVRVVADQARGVLEVQLLEKSLDVRATRQVIARHYDILPGDVTTRLLWNYLEDHDRAKEYLEEMRTSAGSGGDLGPERLAHLAAYANTMNQFERAGRLTADIGGGWLGLGSRMAWLLLASMLVCAIGISNAMLMTVTERFREIATLKCLGALDGFIMSMFVLESCMMGLVGGIAGGILGAALGSIRMLVAFGSAFTQSFPLLDLAASIGVAVLVGIVLAAIAAVYPSFRAARLAPMEAMRVE